MTETQAHFLLQVLKFTPTINIPALAEKLNLSTAATSMRITRLKKKAADNRCDGQGQDFAFLAKVLECSNGKIDFKGLAEAVGMNNSAVRMRLTRLRRKFGAATAKTRKVARTTTDGGRTRKGKVDFKSVKGGIKHVKMEDVKHEVNSDSEGSLVFDEDAMTKELDEKCE
jgi:predicted transcriptional regulator